VAGTRPILEGETVALTATARWSNGATQSVTNRATWSSEDPRVATVSQQGVVFGLAAGEARVTATFNAVQSTATVSVAGHAHFALSLHVHEGAPTENVSIAGAAVTAVDSGGNPSSGRTDASGRVVLNVRAGPVRITLASNGYETSETGVDVTGEAVLELPLVPVLQELRQSFEYVYPVPPGMPFIDQRRFRVNAHHSGLLIAQYTGTWQTASPQAHTCIEVRDSANRILDHTQGQYDNWAPVIRLAVVAGQAYEVAFYSCNPYGPAATESLAGWAGEVKHPS
jgi:hypothetical protein